MSLDAGGSRERLLSAAEELLVEEPAEPLSVRAVCTRAGVQFPTLYHFFANKQGLIDAVIASGFATLSGNIAQISSTEPRSVLSQIWDAHVSTASCTSAQYALMYGSPTVGSASPSAHKVTQASRDQLTPLAAGGHLSTTAATAAFRLTTAAVGASFAVIADPSLHPEQTDGARTSIVQSLLIANETQPAAIPSISERAVALHAMLVQATSDDALTETIPFNAEETSLLSLWLTRLADTP